MLYVGSSYSKNKAKKASDHFTGLHKRVGQFIICAMGFGTAHHAGRKLFALQECGWCPASVAQPPECDTGLLDTPWPTVRDVEVRWAVVADCPRCAERQAYSFHTPPPLFNGPMHEVCKDKDCPRYAAYLERCRAVRVSPRKDWTNFSL